ncbi:MAG TPA: LysR family transcriptional regulator [Allosphingosinicella sp.]|nr:LysR family transcriptional regulator [Allosphingosinicella sp.]
MVKLPTPPPGFTAVPLRARRDGWTPERQFGYLVALAACGHGGRAAEAVGMSQQSAIRLRRRPQAAQFDRLCSAALNLAKKRHARARRERLRGKGGGSFSASREAET